MTEKNGAKPEATWPEGLTPPEAFKNLKNVADAYKGTKQEHEILGGSLNLIADRMNTATRFEGEAADKSAEEPAAEADSEGAQEEGDSKEEPIVKPPSLKAVPEGGEKKPKAAEIVG